MAVLGLAQHGGTRRRFRDSPQEHSDEQGRGQALEVDELRADHETARNCVENIAEYDGKASAVRRLGKNLLRLLMRQMFEIAARNLGPRVRAGAARSQILNGALVAEMFGRGGQVMIGGEQILEVLLFD